MHNVLVVTRGVQAATKTSGRNQKDRIVFLALPSSVFFPDLRVLCCLVRCNAHSLTGLLIVANKRIAHRIGLSHAFLFASGALLTASLLHIIPEAMEVRLA